MRKAILILTTLGVGLVVTGHAVAGKKAALQAQIEADLVVEVSRTSPARVRPGEPIHVAAKLVNRSKLHKHKVISPGNGCQFGIVEPYLTYSARFLSHDGKTRVIEAPPFQGMCGMGDYRWQRLVRDLGPGASFDLTGRMSWASAVLDMKACGRYDVSVHYAYRAKGTTEKLPQADPVGDLGPMKDMPAFEIISEPVRFDVVRPFEVFVEVTGALEKGVRRRLSDLVTVRVENETQAPITLRNTRLEVRAELKKAKGATRIERTPMAFPAVVLKKELKPGEGMVVIGPKGWWDEEWTPRDDGHARLWVTVAGYAKGGASVSSHLVTIPAAKK